MKRLHLFTGTMLLGLSAVTVHAGDPGARERAERDRFPIDIAAAAARHAEYFAKLDTDGDGRVTAAEFAAGRWHGMGGPRMHGGKGRYGPGPAHGWHERRREHGSDADGSGDEAARAAYRAEQDAKLFAMLDKDGDGKLSAAEFDSRAMRAARHELRRTALFERLDANGDGVLTPDEMPDPVSRLRSLDADGDGTVTREEARAMRHGVPKDGG